MQIRTDGVVSFGSALNFSLLPLPLSGKLLAPLWDLYNFGPILFRLSENQTLFNQVGSIINDHLEYDFTPTMLLIVTWNRIPEYRGSPDIVSVIIIIVSYTSFS